MAGEPMCLYWQIKWMITLIFLTSRNWAFKKTQISVAGNDSFSHHLIIQFRIHNVSWSIQSESGRVKLDLPLIHNVWAFHVFACVWMTECMLYSGKQIQPAPDWCSVITVVLDNVDWCVSPNPIDLCLNTVGNAAETTFITGYCRMLIALIFLILSFHSHKVQS